MKYRDVTVSVIDKNYIQLTTKYQHRIISVPPAFVNAPLIYGKSVIDRIWASYNEHERLNNNLRSVTAHIKGQKKYQS
jgi:hypothetical protein